MGEIPGAYEHAFKFNISREDEEESEPDLEPFIEGMVDVNLSEESFKRIREPWSKALIENVFGRTVGFNYLSFKINALWKHGAKLD